MMDLHVMHFFSVSCQSCWLMYSIEHFEDIDVGYVDYMIHPEERLQRQVELIHSGSCGHNTDNMDKMKVIVSERQTKG